MIPREFLTTLQSIRNYNNAVEAQYGGLSLMTDYDLVNAEYLKNPETGNNWLEDISNMFDTEYHHLTESKSYFIGCDSELYQSTYPNRLKKYIRDNADANELSFLLEELRINYTYAFADYISQPSRDVIKRSLELARYFLESKLSELGYEVLYDPNYFARPQTSFILRLEKTNENNITTQNADSLRITEKVIYLHELGVLDFLRTKEPFVTSTNRLGEILSKLLGEKQTTLQSYINPIYSAGTSQKNNPLTQNPNAVVKTKSYLAAIGFKK